jgi:hypothetical protein
MCCPGEFIDHKQHISDINIDTALQFRFKGNIPTHCFPVTIESGSDQVAPGIDYGATGITPVISLSVRNPTYNFPPDPYCP